MADQKTTAEGDKSGATDAPTGVVNPDKASGGASAGFPADDSAESTSAADAPSGS